MKWRTFHMVEIIQPICGILLSFIIWKWKVGLCNPGIFTDSKYNFSMLISLSNTLLTFTSMNKTNKKNPKSKKATLEVQNQLIKPFENIISIFTNKLGICFSYLLHEASIILFQLIKTKHSYKKVSKKTYEIT